MNSGRDKKWLTEARQLQDHLLASALCMLLAAYGLPAKPQGAASVPGGNSQQAGQQRYILNSQTNVVLVDARVTDKKGNPVTDLKQSDFRVLEEGVPQQITSFSLEDVASLVLATGENGPPPTINLQELPPGAPVAKLIQDHRLIVLFFDLTSMPVDDLARALKAATNFTKSQMTPADLVALVTYTSELRVIQDFTNDRDALNGAINKIRLGEASSLAGAGTEGGTGTTNASGQEVVNQDVSAAFIPDETEFNIFNTDEKLAAVESLSEMLGGVPGRKSVIHFSSGLERTGIENQAELRAATDAANRSNVSFYTVDARGLVSLPPGGDASTASPAGTAIYSGSAVSSQLSSLQGGRETLASLAADTGGRTFYDLNDFAPAFERVQAENSSYYLLGYSPSNTKSDGRFRRIRVEVARAGVKVEARPGYFAPKDFRQFTHQDKNLQLQQAMDLDTPFVDLPFAVEAAYFRQPDGKFYVVLAAKISGSAVSFLQKSQTHQTEFDFAWRATDRAGHTAAALRDTLPVKLSAETYQQVVGGNILYEGGFVLPAGKYNLKVVARENQSGKLGTFEEQLVLPETSETEFALSSVVLSNELQEVAAPSRSRPQKGQNSVGTRLQVGSKSVLPSVTRVFRGSQKLYIYLESYGGKPTAQTDGKLANSADATGSPKPASTSRVGREGPLLPPSVALTFFRGGVKVAEAGPFPGRLEDSSEERASYFVEIPLQKFPPGRYVAQVNVLDPSADRVAFARVAMAIIKPPAASPSVLQAPGI
jgi:VWFA-related protein